MYYYPNENRLESTTRKVKNSQNVFLKGAIRTVNLEDIRITSWNLKLPTIQGELSVSQLFYGSMVFEDGQQFRELYFENPKEVHNYNIGYHGKVVRFNLLDQKTFIVEEDLPEFFFIWLMVHAIDQNQFSDRKIGDIKAYSYFTYREERKKNRLGNDALAVCICKLLIEFGVWDKCVKDEKYLHLCVKRIMTKYKNSSCYRMDYLLNKNPIIY